MMKSSLIRINLIFILLILFIPNLVSAESKTFIKEYTYQASEDDSRNSSRTIALREVKRLLLEELGTYLESVTEVKDFKLTKDQITTLTAGIVKTEIVDEKWDGHTYWLKTKIVADSGEVIKSIDVLRKDIVRIRELEEIKRRSDELLRENERLREQLASAKVGNREEHKAAYDKTIKELSAIEWFEKGLVLDTSGNYNDAIDAYSKAIELNQEYSFVYFSRGITYGILGKHLQAIIDFNKAIELNPKAAWIYYNRGVAYGHLDDYSLEIQDYNKAIELNPKLAIAYYNRGQAYYALQNHNQAIKDYSKAIELNLIFAKIYFYRGMAYGGIGNDKQAIKDFSKAIELDPQYAEAYFRRGGAFYRLGKKDQAIKDYEMGATLGHGASQALLELLRRKN